MHTKKYLVSTLLASALLFGVANISPAKGDEQTLQPQGSWSISKVDRSAQGGNSYCTLSRKYDGDIILSLGRNMAEEYSLALDFQKEKFDKDKAVKINLQPGPGKLRSYDLLPASSKAVVVRLGWDKGFFETLNGSQKMNVKIGEDQYAFSMPLIAKGQADLEDCMEGLKTAAKGPAPAAIAPVTDVLNAAPMQASKAFDANRMKEDTAQAKLALADQEKQIVRNFASSMEAQEVKPPATKSNFNKPAEKTVAVQTAQKAAPLDLIPSSAKATTMAAVEPASGANNTPTTMAAAAVAAAPIAVAKAVDDGRLKALEKQVSALASENAAFKAQAAAENSTQNKAQEQLATMQKQIGELMAENTLLQTQISGAAQNVSQAQTQTGALEKRMAELTMENAALLAKAGNVEQSNAQIAALQKQLNDQAAQYAAANSSITEANNKIAALMTENESYKAKAAIPVASLPQDTARIAELEKKNADLMGEAASYKVAAGGLEQSNAQIAALQKQLNDQAAQYAAANSSITEANNKIAALMTENESYKAKSAIPVASLPQDTTRIAELEKKVADLNAENVSYQARANEPVIHSSLPADLARIADLEKRLAAMNVENESLKTATASTGDTGADRAKVLELETKNKSLQDRLDAVALQSAQKPDAADVAQVQEQVKELQAKNKQLEDNLRSAQTRIAEAAVGSEAKALRTLTDMEIKLTAAQKDNAILAKELEDVKTTKDEVRLSAVTGNWDLEKATKRFSEAERENRRMGRELEQARMSCNVEKAKIEQMLFDPAVADQKQIDKLAQLELELQQAKAQMAGRGGNVVAAPVPSVEISRVGDAGWQQEKSRLMARIAALESDDKFSGISPLPDQVAINDARVKEIQAQNDTLRKDMEKMRAQLLAANSSAKPAVTTPIIVDRVSSAPEHHLASIAPAAGNSAQGKGLPETASFSSSDLKTLLQKAGVSSGAVQKSGTGMVGAENYSWSGGNGVQGASSVKAMKSPAEFEKLVDQYITARKSECGGDFASIPTSPGAGAKKMTMYETACVGGATSASASTLFFMEQGRFIAISSQTGTDNMDQAMDSRDRIASVVSGQ